MDVNDLPAPGTGALDELLTVPVRGSNPYVQAWKEDGGLVFGFMCSYVPEEILEALGILPIRVGGVGATYTHDADVYLHRFNCTYARSLLQLGLEGEYDFLDGFVFLNGCEQLRRLYEIWKREIGTDFLGMVTIPHSMGKARFDWYVDEIRKLMDDINCHYALTATEERFHDSIATYNKFRTLLYELYRLRAKENPFLTGAEAMKITNAAFNMPKRIFNERLEEALQEIRERPGISHCRARLMLAGGFIDDTFLIDLIEALGAVVVTDNLCYGRRYIEGEIQPGNDPLHAIAERYFYNNPCPRAIGCHKIRSDLTKKLIEEAHVDGVIFQRLAFCDSHGVESTMQASDVEAMGIPALNLERVYMPADEGRMKTRVQAFLERIGE